MVSVMNPGAFEALAAPSPGRKAPLLRWVLWKQGGWHDASLGHDPQAVCGFSKAAFTWVKAKKFLARNLWRIRVGRLQRKFLYSWQGTAPQTPEPQFSHL